MSEQRRKNSNSQDAALFRDAVGEVRPLKPGRPHRPAPAPPPRARLSRHDARRVLEESLREPPDWADVETGEELLFRRNGVATRTLRRLRRGEFAVRDELDLHGLTAERARAELRLFLEECAGRRAHCVRVIHGKGLGSGPGGPVLKHRVNQWLRQWDMVLAFCSAQPRHGGTGAVYVLLRR